MPQMAPLYWEILFIMFLTSMMVMMTIIFHMPWNKIKSNNINKKTIKQINWKW
uniref:ATP synthase F0 subunit 8 n=1 Tax=Calliphara nobilis TaxID=696912 RepID=A0A2P1CLZ5_9HEMI|nr:ATP synthase F0 subunit 8 [Calliphara nobilis]